MSKKKDKEIEIVIGDEVFPAELFWKEAPKTCELVLNALPLDFSKPKWGLGTVFQPLHHTSSAGFCLKCMLPEEGTPWAAPPENQKFVLEAGDCVWKTYLTYPRPPDPAYNLFHQEMYIAYRGTNVLGYRGVNLTTNFARITDKLDKLAAIGDEVWSKRPAKNIIVRKKE